MQKIANLKGLTYAAISSSTFGLAPFFSIRLLNEGFSPFEVLSYRWGTASLALLAFGLLTGVKFHMERRNFGVVFLLSLLRATTSLSLVFAYANIASGVASIIHFMYPLAVARFPIKRDPLRRNQTLKLWFSVCHCARLSLSL